MASVLEAIFKVDATGVRTGLKQARGDMNDFIAETAKLGAGVAVGAFLALAKGAVDLAGHLSDAANNIGINVEALQALEAQHKRNGVSQEELTKALQKTRSAVIGAAQGNKTYSDALAVLRLRGDELLDQPLDQQYAKIASSVAHAEDKAQAYAAVSALLGEKVGPKLMGSLKELGEQGFDKVMKGARDAGQVMSAETIVALDRAGDAIDDFKRKATIAVGNIIVNFRSEDGLKLLGLKLMKIAGEFGGMILDFFVEAGGMAYAVLKGAFLGSLNYLRDGYIETVKFLAEQLNKILPKSMEIHIAGLDQFKSDGKGIADSITDAIAHTSPSTFKKDFGDSWQRAINDQQKIVDGVNRIDLKPEADKLRHAGDKMKTDLSAGAKEVAAAATPLATTITKSFVEWNNVATKFGNCARTFMDAANQFSNAAMTISHKGMSYSEQSTTALEGVVERLRINLQNSSATTSGVGGTAHSAEYYVYQNELYNAEKELSMRREVADYAQRYGETAAIKQYGDTLVQKIAADLAGGTDKTNQILTEINHNLGNFVNQ